MSLVRISEIRVYMLLYLGLFMDTGLAVISMIRLYDLNISLKLLPFLEFVNE